ncbi:putative n-acetyltransferase p20 [Fusarium flagelliforme]|uniref:Putative n-acetyltransferase p20 n=1 Tax=Fusarium flagelliforme TaxID=2675880 RepID=A0A395MZX7_9HYPO|nr:putative n-acetyltransferase p20 [Fusarium flagelliforme]
MTGSITLFSPSPPSEEQGTILVATERLIIRRYRLSDAAAMASAANNKAIAANMRSTFPSPYGLSDAENFLANMACKPDGTSYPYHNGIFLKASTVENPSTEPLFIGSMGVLLKNDIYFRTWEIGYWLAEQAWGKGYATEATKAFVKWCFETWPELNRIEATAIGRNIGSQNVLKKSGFVEEGNRRGAVFKNGELLDELQFGLLRSDL